MKNELFPGEDLTEAFKEDAELFKGSVFNPDRFKFPDKYRPAPKKKKQSPANSLTDAVISLIKLLGGIAYRINSQGQWDQEKGIWRPSGTKKGIPDVFACLNGKFITLEIKIGKDKMSEDQQKRKAEIENAKGVYIIARDIEQTRRELQARLTR